MKKVKPIWNKVSLEFKILVCCEKYQIRLKVKKTVSHEQLFTLIDFPEKQNNSFRYELLSTVYCSYLIVMVL